MYPCLPAITEAGFIRNNLANYKPECRNLEELRDISQHIECVRQVCGQDAEVTQSLDEIEKHLTTLFRPDIPIQGEEEPPDVNEAYKQALRIAERVVAQVSKHYSV